MSSVLRAPCFICVFSFPPHSGLGLGLRLSVGRATGHGADTQDNIPDGVLCLAAFELAPSPHNLFYPLQTKAKKTKKSNGERISTETVGYNIIPENSFTLAYRKSFREVFSFCFLPSLNISIKFNPFCAFNSYIHTYTHKHEHTHRVPWW